MRKKKKKKKKKLIPQLRDGLFIQAKKEMFIRN